jgi:uncharacterized membrane protein
MESKAKLLGHPVHQMLIVFPLGLLVTSVIFDLLTIWHGNPGWSNSAFYMIGAGVVGGLAAAVFGLMDWLAIPGGTRAKTIGSWHGLGNLAVVVLFAASWYLRSDGPANPTDAAMALSFAGAGISLVTGWLGGELVDRLGVGVSDDAHVDAPSSLENLTHQRTMVP